MFAVGAIWYFVQKYFHPDSTDPSDFQRLVLFFAAFLIIDFFIRHRVRFWNDVSPKRAKDAWLLSQVWLQRFAYRQLFSMVLFRTLKRAIEGQRFAWDKTGAHRQMSFRTTESHDSVKVP